ncbi:MAG: hypothetical protein L6R41_003239 [Letrouitia leprolyta]|nr:MAG: hypothetical protein L6R41_003239 [Letrouitia leprolyta]
MASSIYSLLPYQPFKAIYILTIFAIIAIRAPLWFFYLLPRALRQHPSYSSRQAFMITLAKTLSHHSCLVRDHPSWSLSPGAEKERFERIAPSKKDVYRGVLKDPEIKPVEIGATWYPTVYGPGDAKRKNVILHFHGGAFIVGDGRKKDLGYGASLLTSHTDAWVLGITYRLSSNPGGRFPAALQDAVTGYQSLLDRGIPASSIVISGDSAGANMAIGLLRYIADNPEVLPKPRAALLWCAWVSPGKSMLPKPCSSNRNYGTDLLNDVFAQWGIEAYAPKPQVDPANPYISPMDHPFKCEGIPLWVQFGELEVLADDILKFADGMRGIEGNDVEIHEDKGVPHDIFLLGNVLGFKKEAEKMAMAMGEWLKRK